MSKTTSVTLGDHFTDLVERLTEEGRFGSASEVVRAGLRLLEEHEMKVDALRAALLAGEVSGPAEPLDIEAFLTQSSRHR